MEPSAAAKRRGPVERDLYIERLNDDGYGVAHDEGQTFYVKGALPGEQVRARILRKRKRIRLAEAVAVAAPAADRVQSRCAAFPRCGGCSLQHLSDAAALRFKEQGLLEALAACGVTAQQVATPVAGPRLHYRRKARLGVKQLGETMLVGFRESFSSRVGRMRRCPVLWEPLDRLLAPFADLIGSLSVAQQVPQLELAAGDTAVQVILRHLAPLDTADLAKLRAFERQQDVQLLLQPGGLDTIRTLTGASPPLLQYSLHDHGLSFEFAAQEFTQVNASINARLVSDVMALLGSGVGQGAIDLFCGIGNFSLALARKGYQVTGYEGVSSAVARAARNATRNGLDARCSFQVADLYQEVPTELPAATAMVLDPPRSGAGPTLAQWLTQGSARGLDRIAYVSCNPTTFASDAAVFSQHGFDLARVGVYDMFPHTSHVETLGLFRRW